MEFMPNIFQLSASQNARRNSPFANLNLCLLSASLWVSMVSFLADGCAAQTVPPRDQWNEQSNSPGATLSYKETGRIMIKSNTAVIYNLFASGLPRDGQYTVSMAMVGTAPFKMADVRLDEEGKIVYATGDPASNIVAGEPLKISILASKGQPFQFAFVSTDGRLRAFTKIIPFPIEADAGPCHLSVEELMPDYGGILILLSGLQSNEAVVLKCNCGKNGHETKGTANTQGTFIAAIETGVKGKQSGTFEFELKAQSCKIGMQIPWGKGADKLQ